MEINNRRISVIIPAYNAEKTIARCLGALKKQLLLPLEIIVVDDGSIDRTVELAKEKAVVIPNIRKKGAGGARNTGAFAAKGDIVAFTDSDCVPGEDWLKNIASVFCDIDVCAVGGGYSSGVNDSFWQRFCYEELFFRRRNIDGQVKTLVSNNFACRRSAFLEEGGFPEEYPVCEDMLLSYKLSKRGKVIWLNKNGVQHHFKNSLIPYLKHQYSFGAESTRFFLQNLGLLFVDNHQGKILHIAIIMAFFCALSGLLALLGMGFLFIVLFILMLSTHFLLYLRFIGYLKKVKFPNISKGYAVSFVRDLVCSLSIFDGLVRSFIRPR